MGKVIQFYAVNEPYGCFSNHAPYPIRLHGKVWPTTEHYFQAQKYSATPHEEAIRLEPSSQVAAEMGRDRQKPLRADWAQVKDNLMREAIRAKFTQHTELREQLLATGDATLVEHTVNDLYWGDGGDGTGKNVLGAILMEIRAELKKATGGGVGGFSSSNDSDRPRA